MKRIVSALLSLIMIFALALPCFAAEIARFNISVVSETDSQIVIALDYLGGAGFACFDLEIDYSTAKLKVTKASKGEGMKNFISHAEENGGAAIASINSSVNPIKATCATTVTYSNVDGKDIFVITFNKLKKEKVTADDIKVYFTNCQTVNFKDVKTSVTTSLAAPPEQDGVKTSAPDKGTSSSEIQSNTSARQTDAETTSVQTENESGLTSGAEQAENEPKNPADYTNKIIIVAAAALCMAAVIAATVVYIVKKSKDNSNEEEKEN